MVLEALLNPFSVKRKPWEMALAGALYSVVGLLLSYFVFRQLSGLLMVFLITLAAIPIVYTSIKREEEIDMQVQGEWSILKEHSKVIFFLLYFFLGIVVGLTLIYIFLPQGVVDEVFFIQANAIKDVNDNVSGNIALFGLFKAIFLNNLKVLFFCLIFSFLYGMGALFILTWNASVVSAAMGNLIKTKISLAGESLGFHTLALYFNATAFGFMRYMTHGLIEISAYFVAGLAGSIISIAVIRHNLENEAVLYDALDLIFISLALLLVAGVVEVYITPQLFSAV